MATLRGDPTPSALAAYVHSELRAAGGGGGAGSGEDDEDSTGDGDGDRRVTSSRRHRGSRHTRRTRHRRSSIGAKPVGKKSGGSGGGGGGDGGAATQEKVMSIISTLIGRDVDVDEPLMDAGLDSLSGAELKSQMEAEFAVELPETVVFDYPTPGALAAFISEERGEEGGEAGAGEDDDTDDSFSEYSEYSEYSDYSDYSEYEAEKKPRRKKEKKSGGSGGGGLVAVQAKVVAIISTLVGREVEVGTGE
jgi:acyl carrier protein